MLPIRDVNPTKVRPLITWGLIAASVIVYFLVQPPGGTVEEVEFLYEQAAIACEITSGEPLDLTEAETGTCSEARLGEQWFPQKSVWLSVGVSMFLHGGLAHLFFNMWSLWIFGNNVEEAFGPIGYALLYAVTGIAATAGFAFSNPDSTIPLVGASGAIAGVMGAYLVLFPRHLVMTLVFFRIVAMPAIFFLGLWFGSQFLLIDEASGIAWEAHVVGFLAGVALTFPFRRRLLGNTLNPDPLPRETAYP